MGKILVLYVFHKFTPHVQHFIDNAIFYDTNIDFIVISNNKDTKFEVPSYVKTLFRDNIGFDFGGWSDALLTDDLYKKYDKFIFANSSIIGPFLPDTIRNKWIDVYINGLSEDIKLFGSSINSCHTSVLCHVQSYIFAMDRATLEFLIYHEIFSKANYAIDMNDAVWKKEVLMSRKIVENGWNIGSLLPHYRGVDFRNIPNEFPLLEDLIFHEYKGKNWNEYQLVFIKNNKGLILKI
jgi:lipopolysaccharide biosynthesis protein